MKSHEVTPEQAHKISSWLVPTMLRLGKLHERMQAVGFPDDDPLMDSGSWSRSQRDEPEMSRKPSTVDQDQRE